MNKLVFIENGRPVTDSLTIAETFGKRHADVLRSIESLECSQEFNERNFALVGYKDTKGEIRPKYLITQDGFSFLVMGFTGKEAARFKEMYINEFNRMKHQLEQPQFHLPQTLSEALRLAADLSDENERLESEKKELLQIQEQQKPLVSFAETCLTSSRSLLVREVAKLASKQGVMIGEKRLFQKLRDWELMFKHRNEPTQHAMEMGLFEIKKGVYSHPDGARDFATPKVTIKGQVYIINRLKKELRQEGA